MTERAAYEIKALTAETWQAFEDLAGRRNGVFGGCWCIWFHPDGPERGQGAEANRALKRQYVEEGGGVVESYPHDLTNQTKKMSSSFLYNSTRSLHERLGFTYDRPKGLRNCVMVKTVSGRA
jgi:hypothetical protein